MSIDDRPTLAAPDNDPYLWLEDIEGQRALALDLLEPEMGIVIGRGDCRTIVD